MLPSVSIALCSFNGADYIQCQLESIIEQTHAPEEIVIIDDGSTDATEEIVKQIASRSKIDIRYFRNKTRLGYRKNFMYAAAQCKSEIIAFCDQDDIWHPQKLQICAALFANPKILLVYHDIDVIDAGGRQLHGYTGHSSFGRQHQSSADGKRGLSTYWANPRGMCQLFRSDLSRFNKFHHLSVDHRSQIGEILAHDQWFYLLANSQQGLGFVEEKLVSYRIHGSNTTSVDQERTLRKFRYTMHSLKAKAKLSQIKRLENDSIARSLILNNISLEANDGIESDNYAKASKIYAGLATVYGARADIYSALSKLDKCLAIMRMMWSGFYISGRRPALGLKALLNDIFFAIFVKP